MPIAYDIIMEKQLVLAKGSGVITGVDVIGHLDALALDDRYKAPMKKLVDYRKIDNIVITSEEASLIAQKKKRLARIFTGERCAFVTPGELAHDLSRVHQALLYGSGLKTEVFRRIEDALKWLDVTLDKNYE